MPTFDYQIYYAYKPTISTPLIDKLSQVEVERNIGLLNDDLVNHFAEIGGSVKSSPNGRISITVDLAQVECDDIVRQHLAPLLLLAEKVPTQNP